MLLRLLAGALTVTYPLLVWWSLGHLSVRWLAFGLIAVAALQWAYRRADETRAGAYGLLILAMALLLGVTALVADAVAPLKLYPVVVNAALLLLFGASLMRGPTVIERLARLREPELPPAAVQYTRRVTQVWCGFFIVNGSIAAATALWADTPTWALYNGLVAYVLMGLLFAGEWCVRQSRRARLSRG
ncbi:hypothetical protein [Caldimonas sp. KR1-144]|uniref:COG4648 family protein n=1 Tax=Caldimonas sp. KR1-144 TaxID=3400911 RepID=UPI003BFD1E6D